MNFSEMLEDTKQVSYDDFIIDSGGIADDIIEMFTNSLAIEVKKVYKNDILELQNKKTIRGTNLGLRKLNFGDISQASEVLSGQVAAVDGTFALPRQDYSTGSALCVAIGSASMTRILQDSLHYWSSSKALRNAQDIDDFLDLIEEHIYKPNNTAFMRYFEAEHAIKIDENFIFFDGLLCDEWLANTKEGSEIYRQLLEHPTKKYIGVIKNCKKNLIFSQYARACPSGSILLIETLHDHISRRETETRFSLQSSKQQVRYFWQELSPRIIRGVFKPYKRAFGFEVLEDHLDDMLRLLAADAHMSQEGHEIPYLLNLVDGEIRRMFKRHKLLSDIALKMNQTSDSIYQEEWDEHAFRPQQV